MLNNFHVDNDSHEQKKIFVVDVPFPFNESDYVPVLRTYATFSGSHKPCSLTKF